MMHQAGNYDASCFIVSSLVYHIVLPELAQAQAAKYDTPGLNYDATCVIVFGLVLSYCIAEALFNVYGLGRKLCRAIVSAWCIIRCSLSVAMLRQHSMIHQARSNDATCVIVSRLVCLYCDFGLRHNSGRTQCYTKPETAMHVVS